MTAKHTFSRTDEGDVHRGVSRGARGHPPPIGLEYDHQESFREDLGSAIASGQTLGQIVVMLREIRDAGSSRQDARVALDTLCARARDEATEDRVLEVMDIVSGFCSPENLVWQD